MIVLLLVDAHIWHMVENGVFNAYLTYQTETVQLATHGYQQSLCTMLLCMYIVYYIFFSHNAHD